MQNKRNDGVKTFYAKDMEALSAVSTLCTEFFDILYLSEA